MKKKHQNTKRKFTQGSIIDGSTSSPGCSVINENPGRFKIWADPVEPWSTVKSPKAAIWSRGKRNNLAANFICLAQSRNRERRPSCLASQRRFLGNVASWAQGTFRKGQDRKQTAKVRETESVRRQTDSKSASPYAFARQAREGPI